MGTRSNKYAEAMAGSGNMTPVEKVLLNSLIV
jgi:hypothetical protein